MTPITGVGANRVSKLGRAPMVTRVRPDSIL
eukprot:CAMPEP_0204465818 /NCGR_PEP_ID=MMETSP0471-20130131/8653_1 /ASSEMBLY_ACC=CAM_ASM_000602 /TAXON_ID=2969 /ORGANISM="Oxyrrhis marina" /LENGTH=30 /DNA_ID= /DNA_START= /DNA_END= /DNA_ORIENTATION=